MAKKATPNQQLNEGYRLLTHQNLPPKRLQILAKLYQKSLVAFRKDPQSAQELLHCGAGVSPEKAALMTTANVLLNLDEVVTKE